MIVCVFVHLSYNDLYIFCRSVYFLYSLAVQYIFSHDSYTVYLFSLFHYYD